ncbi:hypothetical protein AB1Y20_000381 [Prymnesium parvum]|uniref:MOSC domain-containing protein n=1 Tax=Prymnesium parvum TaxID=97485 RepID=A0AB34K838_PRYPA
MLSRTRHSLQATACAVLLGTLFLLLRRRRRLAPPASPHDERAERKRRFRQTAGASYGYSASPRGDIDTWRRAELPGLIAPLPTRPHPRDGIVYLDYAGASLPTASQLHDAARALGAAAVLANPHSTGPAAAAAADAVERAARLVLAHFCGDAAHEWSLVWTSGATAALRLVAESFPFTRGSTLLYPHNSHTSVLGMRVPAAAAGADCRCVSTEALTRAASVEALARGGAAGAHHLAVLPMECNLTGDRLAVGQIFKALQGGPPADHAAAEEASPLQGARHRRTAPLALRTPLPLPVQETGPQLRSLRARRWWLMLDAAKAAATGPVHLPSSGAAFCCVSFYKLFGEPTGLGALLVRNDAAPLLTRGGYFGGGSVAAVLAASPFHIRRAHVSSAFALGTVHFRGAAALPAGFERLRRLGGSAAVEAHAKALALELVRRLAALVHRSGEKAIALYGQWGELAATDHALDAPRGAELPGATVAFNVRRADGEMVGYAEVAKLAALYEPPIQLRVGCCCNPGGCQRALGLTDEMVRAAAASGKECGDETDLIGAQPTGVVRASIGQDSIWEDVDALLQFVQDTFVDADECGGVAAPHPSPRERGAAQLASIFVYPIKSCGAMAVRRWRIDAATGRLELDREWAVLDSKGAVMKLSSNPRMALLSPQVDLEARTLTVHAPSSAPLVLGLDDGAVCTSGEEAPPSREVRVCGEECRGRPFGGEAAARWLSSFLGVQCSLVRHVSRRRPEGGTGGAAHAVREEAIAFANESPLLLLSQASVDALNRALRAAGDAPVSSCHFRPNLVVEGGGHSVGRSGQTRQVSGPEDGWAGAVFAGGAVRLRVTGMCARCAMVEIDPSSGAKHGTVLRALARHRRQRSRLIFGVFCEPFRVSSGHQLVGEDPSCFDESRFIELVCGSDVTPISLPADDG